MTTAEKKDIDLILAAMRASQNPTARKIAKIDPTKKPILLAARNKVLGMLLKQVISIRDHQFGPSRELSDLSQDQWEVIFALIGPFFQLLLKLIGL